MKILAINLKQIGDTLLWEPALRFIKQSFPESRLSVLINDYTLPMLKNHPCLDKIYVFDRRIKSLKLPFRIKKEIDFVNFLRKEKFDLLFAYSIGERTLNYSFWIRAKGKKGIFYKKKLFLRKRVLGELVEYPLTHTILKYLYATFRFLGKEPEEEIKNFSPRVDFFVSEEAEARAEEILKRHGVTSGERIILVHPVAEWFLKCLPVRLLQKIILFFLKDGYRVILSSGKKERELRYIKELIEGIKDLGIIDLSGRVDLEVLGGILKGVDLFFGIDTAPMHMAAALNVPVFAVFGPTGKHEWGPWDNSTTWHSFESPYKIRGFQQFGKHFVFQRDFPCVPCGGKKGLVKCNLKPPQCLDIPPEELIFHFQEFSKTQFSKK